MLLSRDRLVSNCVKYLRSYFIIFSGDEYGGVQISEEPYLMLILKLKKISVYSLIKNLSSSYINSYFSLSHIFNHIPVNAGSILTASSRITSSYGYVYSSSYLLSNNMFLVNLLIPFNVSTGHILTVLRTICLTIIYCLLSKSI